MRSLGGSSVIRLKPGEMRTLTKLIHRDELSYRGVKQIKILLVLELLKWNNIYTYCNG